MSNLSIIIMVTRNGDAYKVNGNPPFKASGFLTWMVFVRTPHKTKIWCHEEIFDGITETSFSLN